MGKDNQDQNTIRAYKGALHGEDWDTYVIQMLRQLREMRESSDKVTSRSWGEYEVIGQGEKWRGKILRINPGRAISLQRHFKREERWIVVEGEGEVWINKDLSPTNVSRESIQVGSIVEIAKKDYHWLHNTSSSAQLVIVEVWLGEELSENDIERVNNDEASVFIEK